MLFTCCGIFGLGGRALDCVGRGHVLGSEVVGGVWVFQALYCNMLSCVWVWVLALGRERARCCIFCKISGVGSLTVLGVAVSVGIGRVACMGGGSGSRLACMCGVGVRSIGPVCCIVLFRFRVGLCGRCAEGCWCGFRFLSVYIGRWVSWAVLGEGGCR